MVRLVLFALLAAGGPVHAQETPAPLAVPGLRIEAREERYELDAERFSQVAALLNQMRIEGEDAPLSQGLTRYSIRPEWRYRPTEDGCEVSRATVDVDITIVLPRWPGAQHASEPEKRRWKEVLEAITRHEYTHRDITVELAGKLLATLRSLEAGTCSALGRAAEGALALVDEELQERHAQFDREDTGFGLRRLPGAGKRR